ncbi:MAG: hypothetical protein AAFR52_08970, partial [Pseudomonadota bacterium]
MTETRTISEAELNAFCDGELDDAESARIAAAIEADPALRARMSRIMSDIAALRAVGEADAEDPATAALATRLESVARRRERRRTATQVATGLAASVAIAAGGWFGHGAYMKSVPGKAREDGMFLAGGEASVASVPS